MDQSPKARNKNELFYSKDEMESDDKPSEKLSKTKEKPSTKYIQETSKQKNKSPLQKEKRKKIDISMDKMNTSKRKNGESSLEKMGRKKLKKDEPTKSFNMLLDGVTLVISGIANPDRGNLRAMALSMGAKYKPDWDNSCTHLM